MGIHSVYPFYQHQYQFYFESRIRYGYQFDIHFVEGSRVDLILALLVHTGSAVSFVENFYNKKKDNHRKRMLIVCFVKFTGNYHYKQELLSY